MGIKGKWAKQANFIQNHITVTFRFRKYILGLWIQAQFAKSHGSYKVWVERRSWIVGHSERVQINDSPDETSSLR